MDLLVDIVLSCLNIGYEISEKWSFRKNESEGETVNDGPCRIKGNEETKSEFFSPLVLQITQNLRKNNYGIRLDFSAVANNNFHFFHLSSSI